MSTATPCWPAPRPRRRWAVLSVDAAILVGIGLVAFWTVSSRGVPRFLRHDPLDTVYDPTNGSVSEGDIFAFGGPARQFAAR